MRKASLHIKRDDLQALLKEFGIKNHRQLTQFLLENGRNKKPLNRTVFFKSSANQRKKVARLAATGDTEYELFNKMLHYSRMKANHRFIQTIRKNSKDYLVLREVADLAMEFCTIFEFTNMETGFKTYCEIGIKIMGKKYGLSKFKYHNTKIVDTYAGYFVVSEDPTPDDTKKMYQHWESLMRAYAGVVPDIDSYEQMKHLVFAKQEADEAGAPYYDWLDATFERLNYLNAVPELVQFYGENAKQRWQSYNIKKNKPENPDKSVAKNLSTQDQEYMDKIAKLKNLGDGQ